MMNNLPLQLFTSFTSLEYSPCLQFLPLRMIILKNKTARNKVESLKNENKPTVKDSISILDKKKIEKKDLS